MAGRFPGRDRLRAAAAPFRDRLGDEAWQAKSSRPTTTMPNMRGVVEAVREADIGAKVVIGSAPVTPEYATQIGADGYALDAGSAVDVARRLLAG